MELKKLNLRLPFGLGGIELAPNDSERQAAWSLYVELTTRVAVQPYDQTSGSLRAVLESLYSIFGFTRLILREAGPGVAHAPDAFGPLAIKILTEGIAPFTTKWHETLRAHELEKPNERSAIEHERAWHRYAEMCGELDALQIEMRVYTDALLEIAGAK